MAGNKLTFLPYLKRQPALTIESSDAGNLTAGLALEIVHSGAVTSVKVPDIVLRGPGDVIGISESMIARREPAPNTVDFEPNYFPYIDFVDPEFAWRYSLTPLSSGEKSKVDPWLSLIVLSDEEITAMTSENIEVIAPLNNKQLFLSISAKYLPDPDLLWANAHVQLSGLTGSTEYFIENNPSGHCSRILCMRKLLPEKRYVAFLVPNYAVAVQAAFGLSITDATDAKAWSAENSDAIVKFPIYSHWPFGTSEQGDFESLARALQSFALDKSKVGTRAVDASLTQLTTPNNTHDRNMEHFFRREGALVPPGFDSNRVLYENESKKLPYTAPMLDSLNESLKDRTTTQSTDDELDDDPLITLPVYGRYFRKTEEIKMPANGNHWPGTSPWVHEMNLDFRYRVTGGFGTEVVQQNQEDYMRKCWEQVGEIRRANEELRRHQAALKISERIKLRHIDPLCDERFAMLTTPFHTHYHITQGDEKKNVTEAMQKSGIAPGVFSSPLRRVVHRRVRINNTKPIQSFENKLKKTNTSSQSSTYSQPGTRPLPYNFSKKETEFLQAVDKKVQDKVGAAFTAERNLYRAQPFASPARPTQPGLSPGPSNAAVPFLQHTESIYVQPVNTGIDFRAMFDIKKAIRGSVDFRLKLPEGVSISENLDPIMMAPKIRDAMYRPLVSLNKDYILPGIENLKNNGTTLCEENRRFIESYLVACNHEMGRELVWRHFPTDQRGSVFSFFWDAVQAVNPPKDIKDIHTWDQVLGRNKAGLSSSPNLVLIVKSDLIRRYPSTIIYAIKITNAGSQPRYWSDAYPTKNPPIDEEIMIDPIFRAQVGHDTLCVGFPFSRNEVQGSTRDGEYYFVLQENQDLPRFGLDIKSERIKQNMNCLSPEQADQLTENDFQWGDAPLDYAGYISNFDFLATGVSTIGSSATIADKTYQLPIRVAIHSSELLPEI